MPDAVRYCVICRELHPVYWTALGDVMVCPVAPPGMIVMLNTKYLRG